MGCHHGTRPSCFHHCFGTFVKKDGKMAASNPSPGKGKRDSEVRKERKQKRKYHVKKRQQAFEHVRFFRALKCQKPCASQRTKRSPLTSICLRVQRRDREKVTKTVDGNRSTQDSLFVTLLTAWTSTGEYTNKL